MPLPGAATATAVATPPANQRIGKFKKKLLLLAYIHPFFVRASTCMLFTYNNANGSYNFYEVLCFVCFVFTYNNNLSLFSTEVPVCMLSRMAAYLPSHPVVNRPVVAGAATECRYRVPLLLPLSPRLAAAAATAR